MLCCSVELIDKVVECFLRSFFRTSEVDDGDGDGDGGAGS